MTTQNSTDHPDIEMFSLTGEMARFRAHVEQEAGMPICELEINAALLLLDLCTFLKLGSAQSSIILGERTATRIHAFMTTRVTTLTKH